MARWGNCDYTQMEQLMKRMEKFERVDKEELCRDLAVEIAARLLRMAKRRTPVGVYPLSSGKTGGTLRRAWDIDNKKLVAVKRGNAYEVTIMNSTEYASYVEFGHRTSNHMGFVPGVYMLTVSEQELKKTAPRIIERKLKQRLSEVF